MFQFLLRRKILKSCGAKKGFIPLERTSRDRLTEILNPNQRFLSLAYTEVGGALTGFTLLETIIAFAVITAAVVGPVALITLGLASLSASKNKLIAENLAQEGIELVRTIRENNIYCDYLNGSATLSWDSDPNGSGHISNNAVRRVDATVFVQITCGGVNILTPSLLPNSTQALLLDPVAGYNYTVGLPTIFTRSVQICSPPNLPSCGYTSDGGGILPPDQMDIVSAVSWVERGISRNVVLRERIYNWE